MILNRYSVTFIHNSLRHHQKPLDMFQKAQKRHHQEDKQGSRPTSNRTYQHEGRLRSFQNFRLLGFEIGDKT